VVTALSAWLFAGELPGPREWAGGACIVLASALSSWVHRSKTAPPDPAIGDTDPPDERDGGAGGQGGKPGRGGDSAEHEKGGKNRPRAMV
jgi:hypothetical protein